MEDNLKTKSLFVSILGKANVGKSSIMNMIVNSKVSIVSPKPQTTRNKVIGIFTDNDVQLVFIDTPGIHRPRTKLGDFMISEVNSAFFGAQACIHVVEAGKSCDDFDLELIKKFKKANLPVVLAINKIDILKDKSLLMPEINKWKEIYDYKAIVPVSAKTCDGKKDLISEIINLAEPSVFYYGEDDITDKTQRAIAAEIIREKLLCNLDKELPHGTAVLIEKFKERENIIDIHATIYCEKSSHKSMIIGKNGSMIKKIGMQSRKDLEDMLDFKVNLQLWVKVKENWRNKEAVLHTLGYEELKK